MRMTIISISPTSRSKPWKAGGGREFVRAVVVFCFGKPTNKSFKGACSDFSDLLTLPEEGCNVTPVESRKWLPSGGLI